MPEVIELEPHPTIINKPVVYAFTALGAGFLTLALLVDCLQIVNALFGLLHLVIAVYLFWWLRKNEPRSERLKALLADEEVRPVIERWIKAGN